MLPLRKQSQNSSTRAKHLACDTNGRSSLQHHVVPRYHLGKQSQNRFTRTKSHACHAKWRSNAAPTSPRAAQPLRLRKAIAEQAQTREAPRLPRKLMLWCVMLWCVILWCYVAVCYCFMITRKFRHFTTKFPLTI